MSLGGVIGAYKIVVQSHDHDVDYVSSSALRVCRSPSLFFLISLAYHLRIKAQSPVYRKNMRNSKLLGDDSEKGGKVQSSYEAKCPEIIDLGRMELKAVLGTPGNAISAFVVDKDEVRDDQHKIGGACACEGSSVE